MKMHFTFYNVLRPGIHKKHVDKTIERDFILVIKKVVMKKACLLKKWLKHNAVY